jgi:hypothetical protein
MVKLSDKERGDHTSRKSNTYEMYKTNKFVQQDWKTSKHHFD